MNLLDIAIALPLIYGMYKGFSRGFVMEIFSLLAWFVAFYVAFNFSDSISNSVIDEPIKEKSYMPSIIFLIILIGVGVGVYLIGKIIEKSVKITMLSLPNKIAGLAFGFVKFLYFSGVVLLLISSFPKSKNILSKETKNDSALFAFATGFVKNTIPGVTSTVVYYYHKNDR